MKKRYLPLYEKWNDQGSLTHSRGLCKEFNKLGMPESGKNKDPKFGEFTPLRQNIILLMAVMNNEL